jgi:hypothetical protein
MWTWSSISGPEGEKFDRIVPMDVDGDGDIDFISTDEDESLTENTVSTMNPGLCDYDWTNNHIWTDVTTTAAGHSV